MESEIKIQLALDDQNKGEFYYEQNGKKLARMVIDVKENLLTVYHTEVSDELKGMNLGKKLLEEMVKYSRSKNLKVIPLCPFVYAQFRRHENEYSDVWEKIIL